MNKLFYAMAGFVVGSIIFLAIIGLASATKIEVRPYIVSQFCEMLEHTNYGCIQQRIKVQNPRFQAVNAGFDCGPENNMARMTIPARTSLEFFMSVDVPLPAGRSCTMTDWYEVN